MTYAIAATGTGGHIFPALAVARALHAKGHDIVWFGVRDGLELNYMQGFEHVALESGNNSGGQVSKLIDAFKNVPKVQEKFMRYNIQKTIVFGGFVSVPVGLSAKATKTQLFLHEQNAKAGKANKMLLPLCDRAFTAYPGVFDSNKVVITGNPLRFNKPWAQPENVLVLGGSLGSGFLNEVMHGVVVSAAKTKFKLLVGAAHYESAKAKYTGLENVEVQAFVEDMHALYDWADAVISRAGAITIAEAAMFNLPNLLIPMPNSADNHQFINAMSAGANTECIVEAECNAGKIVNWLNSGPKSALDKILDFC